MKIQMTALAISLAAACTSDTTKDPNPTVTLPPGGGIPQIHRVPQGMGSPQLFGGSGSFTFTGATAPGNASYTNAPVADTTQMSTPATGTGSVDVTISGTEYASTAVETVSFVMADDTGTNYAVVDGAYPYTATDGSELMTEITTIVLASDFAIGVPIALDGVDRVALFANGDPNAEQPTTEGAAISGTVTFTAGSLTTGSLVSATVTGDFGPIDFTGDGGGMGSGSGSGSDSSAITPGSYTLAVIGPSQVYCEGALVGHEADFAGITLASLGLVGGSVTVATPTLDEVTVAGAPISSSFGASPFELDDGVGTPGLFAGFTNATGAGPDSTTFMGEYLVIDASTATSTFINAGVGAGYIAADGSSNCTVAFGASLTSP